MQIAYEDVYSDSDIESSLRCKHIEQHDFVLAKLCGKKSVKYYVAQVLEEDKDGDYNVKFMRKTSNNTFVFPSVDDIASVTAEDIHQVLQPPKLKRGHYQFCEPLYKFLNLS